MKSIISLLIGISVIVIIITVIYFVGFLEITDSNGFLEITNYEIIQKQNNPLVLSVIVSEEIPIDEFTDYGFAWLSKDSDKLYGYTSNTHSNSEWHTESIRINDSKQFCFDEITNVISNVIIDKNKIKTIIELNDSTNFDKIISYEILKDESCRLGYAGIVIDEMKN